MESSPDVSLFIYLKSKGMSNRGIGRLLGVDEKTVRNGLKKAEYKSYLVPLGLEDRFAFKLDEPINVEDDAVAITADFHIPLYDPAYVNRFIETCRATDTTTIVIGGDFFNFDALSQYLPKQDEAKLELELREASMVLRVLLETFDRIVYIWGNHDARLHKALGFAIQFKEAMRMVFGNLGETALEKIEFSNLDHCWIQQSDGREWYVCHPQNYSRIPLSTPRALAAKYNTNVITAHAHHAAIGYAVDGEHIVAEAGGFFDRHKTAYLQRTTTHPQWVQGFALLRSGEPILVDSPGFRTLL